MNILSLEKAGGWALVLLLGVGPLIHNASLYDFANLPQAAFIQAICFVLPVLAAMEAVRERKLRLPVSRLHGAILLFFLWCLASLLWSHHRADSWAVLRHWLAGGFAFACLARLPYQNWHGALLAALSLASMGVSLLGCAQEFFQVDWIPQAVPPAATFGNKNMAADFISLVLPINLSLLLTARHRRGRALAGAALGFSLVFLWRTHTWTAWLASALALAFLFFYLPPWRSWFRQRRKLPAAASGKRLLVATAIVLILAGAMTVPLVREGPGMVPAIREKVLSPQGSFAIRLHMWRSSLFMVAARPFSGVGLGNFRIFYPLCHNRAGDDPTFSTGKQPRNLHDDYLQLAVELGLPGLLLFLCIPAVALREVRIALRRPSATAEERTTLLCLAAGLLSFSVLALAAYPLYRSVSALFFFVLLGLIAAKTRTDALSGSREIPLPRYAGIAATTALLCLFAVILKTNGDSITADRFYKVSQQAEHAGDWLAAREAAERATAYAPANDEILSALGLALARTNEPVRALAAFRKALDLHPYNVNVLINLAAALREQGERQERLSVLERILAILPEERGTLKSLAALCLQEGRHDAALEYYRRLVRLVPDDARSYANLGYLYGKKGLFEQAAAAYEQALAIDPGLVDIHRSLGVIYSRHLGRPDKAALHQQH